MIEGRALQLTGVFVFFATSALGVATPMLLSQKMKIEELIENWIFISVKCFATGIILGVAVLHLLADAIETLGTTVEYPCKHARINACR